MPPPPEDPYAEERRRWRSFSRQRPAQVEPAGPGEESVWDYPRPPALERSPRVVVIELAGVRLVESRLAQRVMETASPPVYYVPAGDVRMEHLEPDDAHESFCEWKGVARYWNARVGDRFIEHVAWSYPQPDAPFEALRDHLAFYPGRVDVCTLDGEPVAPQPGEFYGGWITRDVKGPFKGEPGTGHW